MDRYGNGEEVVMDKVFDSGSLLPSFRNFNKELFVGEFWLLKNPFNIGREKLTLQHIYRYVCLSWL